MISRFTARQIIPSDRETVWEFISSPANLKMITPPYMGFEIVTQLDSKVMYPGQIIEYKVSPLAGIKMSWVTEITHVRDLEYFVDEQRFGPYSFWHHKHFLKSHPDGVEMTDIVDYKVPLGPLGEMMNSLVVKKKLKEIFDFRYRKVEEIFGTVGDKVDVVNH
jgi:ligand-binding SRPBCC domain-containing protein